IPDGPDARMRVRKGYMIKADMPFQGHLLCTGAVLDVRLCLQELIDALLGGGGPLYHGCYPPDREKGEDQHVYIDHELRQVAYRNIAAYHLYAADEDGEDHAQPYHQ